jgi:hypothetical protein
MKKTLSLSLILASSLLLSACGVKNNSLVDSSNKSDSKASFSLRELIAKNIPQKCVWTTTDSNGTTSTGTMIISGQKFNQQVVIKEPDTTLTMHVISDGTWIYSWQENPTAQNSVPAMKMKLEETQAEAEKLKESVKEAQNNQASFGSVIDYDNKTEYNCSSTVISGNDFQPPTDINFQDYSKFLDDLKSSIPEINITNPEQ